MVWACISYEGPRKLIIVDGNMDKFKYVRILSENLTELIKEFTKKDDLMFQQDNAPAHKAKFTMRFFKENKINLLEWPAQSPDLNIIENLWAYMKFELRKFKIKTKNELIKTVTDIWQKIPLSYIRGLYDSIPRRVESVLRSKGAAIKY